MYRILDVIAKLRKAFTSVQSHIQLLKPGIRDNSTGRVKPVAAQQTAWYKYTFLCPWL